MRRAGTGAGRWHWSRFRAAVIASRPRVSALLLEWLQSCRQTPAALWLVVLWRSATARWARDNRRALAEIALYVGAYLAYVFSRGIGYENVREVAIANGGRIAELQGSLGFLWEPAWQAWAIEHIRAIVVFLNWAYILTYWPVILGLAIVLFLRNRRQYYYFRTVVLLDLVAALLAFMLFPVASPFAIPGVGLVDTIQAFGPTFYGTETMAAFYNTSAAMPSLHFSWTVILGVYCWKTLPGWFKSVGLVYPVLTFFAIVLTGNHFILDAIVGGVLAGLCFGLVEAYRLASRRIENEDLLVGWVAFSRKVKQWQISKLALRWDLHRRLRL